MNYKDKNLLIVDDFVMSGDTLEALRDLLIKNGFREEKIKTLAISTTKVAISNHKAPDYYWLANESDDFYFP